MQTWLNFWTFLFWLTIVGFLINLENFFRILIYSEIVWVVLYTYTVTLGSVYNDITIISTSFFILALAGLEFSIGILILVLFKNVKKTTSLSENNKTQNMFNIKNLNLTKLYWNN